MKTLDLNADPDLKRRFERNLDALEPHNPTLVEQLRRAQDPISKLVETETGLNLDIGHTLFYDTNVETFVDTQFSEFEDDPYRINIGWPDSEYVPPRLISRLSLQHIKVAMEEAGIGPQPEGKQRDTAGFIVSLGIGIGDHIGRLIDRFDAQSLVLVEQFQDFIWFSLHLNPWDEWIEKIEAQNGKVFIIMSDSAPSAITAVVDALRSDHGGTLDGSLLYTHYRSSLVRQIHKGLSDQISYIGSNRGFFEDENIMIQNATRNFIAKDFKLWRSRPRREKVCPAFVVAAGPSVDGSIDVIRKFRDGVVLISCGSGLKVLLAYGIKPDYHVEVENTFGQADILERVASQHDLSGITLVAAATVNPRTAAVFDETVFFHRDSVCSTRFLEMEVPIQNAVPTVANCGLRFALGMAFREIYLFGVDLGKRIDAPHHSKQSAYYTDEDFMFSFQGTEESVRFPFKSEANFGGLVQTSDGFLLSRLFLERVIRNYRGYNVYNCSDGIEIPNSIPRLPSSVDISIGIEEQKLSLKQMSAELIDFEACELTPLYRYQDLRNEADSWFSQFYERIERLKKDVTGPFDAFGRISQQFMEENEADVSPEIAVLRQSTYGTVFTLFSNYFRFHRRIDEKHEEKMLQIFLDELMIVLKDMEVIQSSVIDELIDEIAAATDLQAAE